MILLDVVRAVIAWLRSLFSPDEQGSYFDPAYFDTIVRD